MDSESYFPKHSMMGDDADVELGRAWLAYEKKRQECDDLRGEVERLKAKVSESRPQTTAGGGRGQEGGALELTPHVRGWMSTALDESERAEAMTERACELREALGGATGALRQAGEALKERSAACNTLLDLIKPEEYVGPDAALLQMVVWAMRANETKAQAALASISRVLPEGER